MKISFNKSPRDTVRVEPDGTLVISFLKTGYLKSVSRVRLSQVDKTSVESFTNSSGTSQNDASAPHGLIFVSEESGQEKLVVVERFRTEQEAEAALALVRKVILGQSRAKRFKGSLRTFAFYLAIPVMVFTLHGAIIGEFEGRKLSKDMVSAVINNASALPGGSANSPAITRPPTLSDSSFIKTGLRFGVKDAPADKTLYVFSDPNCPSCKELDKELRKLHSDFSVYVFPLAFKSGSEKLSSQVLCAKDQAAKWDEVSELPAGGTTEGNDSCADAKKIIQANMNAFISMGFTKTPTVLTGNGQVFAGSMPAESIRKMMQEQKR